MNTHLNELIKPSTREIDRLECFYKAHINAQINLTAIKNKDDFYVKHYLDSIYIFKKYNLNFKTLIDVGSGGGFPGVVLAIFYPHSHIYLIESIGKKCVFLTEATKKCRISNISIINDRVENINNIKGDIITARAVSTVKNILKHTIQLSHKKTKWIIYKGMKMLNEVSESKSILKKYNLTLNTERVDEPFKRTYIIISH